MMDEDRKKRLKDVARGIGKASLSGALPGAVLGGGGGFLEGLPAASIRRKALLGALVGGGIAGTATAAGSALLGAPEEDDPGAYGTRGVVGGVAAGGLLGGAAGLANVAGKVSLPEKLSKNAAARYLERLAETGGLGSLAKGAGIGALAGAALGGYQGWSEGSAVDSIQNADRKARAKRHAREEIG